MKSLRDEIAIAVKARSGEVGAGVPLAVDVLTMSGIRANHKVPEHGSASAEPDLPAFSSGRRPEVVGRYTPGGRLGEGGMGVVDIAHDRNLGRDVALKSLLPGKMEPRRVARFVAEAQITAQLEHPGIVPVHDLFITPDGDLHYSMKRVSGMSLREVLDGLRGGDPAMVEKYNLIRLLGVFHSACNAVAYAHTRRIIHRDLKPANIMVGDFGVVMVMDWGVARLLDDPSEAGGELVDADLIDSGSAVQTADGLMVGSPAYMAPEQLEVGPSAIDPRADVYALGVILYELLTLTRPYQADSVARLLYLAAKGEHPAPSARAPSREVPAEVEAICQRALTLRPADRYRDAGELTAALDTYMEGVGPRREADRLVLQGLTLKDQFEEAAKRVEDERLSVKSLETGLKPWDPIDMKRGLWDAERKLSDAVAEADRFFGDCEAAYESALSHLPTHRGAQDGLADLYWTKFLTAEKERDDRWTRRWEELIRRYAPERYARRLEGAGTLTVTTSPARARATLRPLEEDDSRLVPGEERALGLLPAVRLPVAMGRYVLELTGRGLATCRLPVVVERGENVKLSPWLAPAEGVRRGFVHVPAGPVVLGGDPAAISGREEEDVFIPDFAIAKLPVSVAQYIAFLNDLAAQDPELARRHLPRARGGGQGVAQEPLFEFPARGPLRLPFLDKDGREWRDLLPVTSVTIHDARAYAEWASARSDGPRLRLPTESEWEKAARGVDRRRFPWGDQFDAGFCVMAESSATPPTGCVIGEQPMDVSPYGVRDLGGGVRDWVEWDSQAAAVGGRAVLRGGSYGTVEVYCRCASRSVVEGNYVGSHVGFRLAHDLPRD